jgi:hypothetical protein
MFFFLTRSSAGPVPSGLLCTDVRALPSREGEEIDRLHLLHRQHKLLNIFSNCSQQQALAKPAIATRTCGTRQLLPCGSQRHSRVKFTYIGIETISFDRTAWLQLSTWITLLSCAEIPIRESVLHYRPFVCDLHLCNTASRECHPTTRKNMDSLMDYLHLSHTGSFGPR